MKKIIVFLCIALFALSSYILPKNFVSSIYGTIEPADAAKMVWAVNGKDSVSLVPQDGKFSLAVSAGIWRLHIEAVKPYKDVTIDSIKVTEGKASDAGVIRMSRE